MEPAELILEKYPLPRPQGKPKPDGLSKQQIKRSLNKAQV